MSELSARDIAGFIDHTLLAPNASREQIVTICEEAKKYEFKSVCVNPLWVSTVSRELSGSNVLTCSVIGFPLGTSTTDTKVFETRTAVADGANEIDMVIDVAAALRGDGDALVNEIFAIAQAAHEGGAILKVIIETCLLTEEAKVLACEAAKAAGADFVKTSTGFSTGGATVEDVALMRKTVGPGLGVKASGGVRSVETARAMIAAGATRLGSSSGVAILEGEQSGSSY
ncbi:deoxyribose-phosphate aldolase [Arthrobacter sp. MYb224]|uniref:deoxyribose-phosphate aldolase n=1 Tax=Micrococcaceae TaxID=1268 RepID=UPI000BB75A85|nr:MULTISPECIES: deoxyribose-phosphate aldolase [Micrococcaceae]PCC28020.1 deoxyribose-phosphate aldolase [Glutamicibacter sp. BW80]PQZ98249.1 deoxyribose-phosphate aldolase [Arthrobacter sp. MYb224]